MARYVSAILSTSLVKASQRSRDISLISGTQELSKLGGMVNGSITASFGLRTVPGKHYCEQLLAGWPPVVNFRKIAKQTGQRSHQVTRTERCGKALSQMYMLSQI